MQKEVEMPYKPAERSYRSFAASNFKPVERIAQTDEDGNEVASEPSYKVRGYASTFNDEYELYPRMGDYPAEYEQIDRHAFDGVNTRDTILQFDHQGAVLARTRNGSLHVGTDDHGLWVEADLSGCQQARDLYESIQNGLIDEMSFGFIIANDDDGLGCTCTRDENGDYHTTITRVYRLVDVSAVSVPANPSTDIHIRSAITYVIEADRKAAEEERAAAERADTLAKEQARARRMRRARALALRSI